MYAIVTGAAIKFPFYLSVISIYVSAISIFSRVSKKIVLLIKNLYTYIYIAGVAQTEEIPNCKVTKKNCISSNISHIYIDNFHKLFKLHL